MEAGGVSIKSNLFNWILLGGCMMTVTFVGVEYKMVFILGQVLTTVVSVHCVRRVDIG